MTQGLEVRQRRRLRSPRQRVWEAWTNADLMMQWFSPSGLTTESVSADVREGGSFRIAMQMPPGMHSIIPDRDGLVVACGEYEQLIEPSLLIFTWSWQGHDEVSRVRIQLTAIDNETELTLSHRQLASIESQNFHEEGWALTFDHLDEALRGLPIASQ